MKNSKKILCLGISLLIIAGIIVVALKGFNVGLIYGKHEAIEVKVGKEVNLDEVKQICNEVFQNKKYIVKGQEVFNDSFQINVQSITDEEKANLVAKINEKYTLTETVDSLNTYSISNRRLRDSIKPYIVSVAIAFAIIFIYMLIRFRKIGAGKLIMKSIIMIILTEAILLSLIAIVRLPLSDLTINLLLVVAVIEFIIKFIKAEKELDKISN